MIVPRRSPVGAVVAAVLVLAVVVAAVVPAVPGVARAIEADAPDHLVVSEVATGGTSASDELIELHNPTGGALPLEGLELIYVTASGATTSRRASWSLGAPSVPAGGHVLVANEAGIYAPIADAVYASGIAAIGGSVALRIQGAASAIDAVGWGSATSSWLEGVPAPAPAAGASIERLPGGAAGSGQDTGSNAADFVERAVPEPQNLLSDPTPSPGASPAPSPTDPTPAPSSSATPFASPTPTASPAPSPTPTVSPAVTATPAPAALSVAEARAAPDGTTVTIEAVAFTNSAFHDGGGFVADATGGIAVLPDAGAFDPGQRLRITGEVDDRFSQRTLRPAAEGIVVVGTGTDPAPAESGTGAIGEALEGRLVHVSGAVMGRPSVLSAALAFDVDDGSGTIRVLVGTVSGIVTDAWTPGTVVEMLGVVGQRDSTGSGTEGYRVMPRNAVDVLAVTPPVTPTPSPSAGEASPSPTPGGEDVATIAEARAATPGARVRARGVVTLPTGLVDDRTAVIQDPTGAILLRLSGKAGSLALGARVEVGGTRSTLAGMESVRVTTDPQRLGTALQPSPVEIGTGGPAESREAQLVVARGAVVTSARRSSSGTVSFQIDDGSGPMRVSAPPGARVDRGPLVAGTWVEVHGVLGQETTRAEPDEGYRIWPRTAADVRVVAPATGAADGSAADGTDGRGPQGGGPVASLAGVDSGDLSRLRIGATLVIGEWAEIGVAGLLWDGSRLVAVHASSSAIVDRIMRHRRPPLALELGGMRAAGADPRTGATLVALGSAPSDTMPLDAAPAAARGDLDGPLPAWVTIVGRPAGGGTERALLVGEERVPLHLRCDRSDTAALDALDAAVVAVTGVAAGHPLRLLVPCGGLRPAPLLRWSATGVAQRDREPASPSLAAASESAAGPDPRRPLAAGVLLAAAAALAVGAWLRRRGGASKPDATEAGTADGAAELPRLTLVRVRNKHGP